MGSLDYINDTSAEITVYNGNGFENVLLCITTALTLASIAILNTTFSHGAICALTCLSAVLLNLASCILMMSDDRKAILESEALSIAGTVALVATACLLI